MELGTIVLFKDILEVVTTSESIFLSESVSLERSSPAGRSIRVAIRIVSLRIQFKILNANIRKSVIFLDELLGSPPSSAPCSNGCIFLLSECSHDQASPEQPLGQLHFQQDERQKSDEMYEVRSLL